MKLFAIAATAASGMGVQQHQQHQQHQHHQGWRRVSEPAPGFVNEQGGYWADQPTHPQAPQVNYQQRQISYQPPQPPQCCSGYLFTLPGTTENVWLPKSGVQQQKPYYEGTDSAGKNYVLFWKFDPSPITPVVEALEGHWYLSDSLTNTDGAITESRETNGIRHCPEAYQSLPYTQNVNLRCGQGPDRRQPPPPPPPQQCCQSIKWTPHNWGGGTVWLRDNGTKHNGKQVYAGTANGGVGPVFIWYEPSGVGSSSGAWHVSQKVGERTSSQTMNVPDGLNSCPDDGKQLMGLSMVCGNPPPPQTCAEISVAQKNVLTLNNDGSFEQCEIQSVMEQLVKGPVEELGNIIRADQSNGAKLTGGTLFTEKQLGAFFQFSNAFNAWQALTQEKWDPVAQAFVNMCGYEVLTPELKPGNGRVLNCNDICANIEDFKFHGANGENLLWVIKDILQLVEGNFNQDDQIKYNGLTGQGSTCESEREKLYKSIGDLEKFFYDVNGDPILFDSFPAKYRSLIEP